MLLLVDENLPRSLARLLGENGFEACDVRDLDLRGHPDSEVLQAALALNAIVLTRDIQFGSLVWKGEHGPGVVLVRLPSETSVSELSRLVVKVLVELGDQVIDSMVVVGPERYRHRRRPPQTP